MVQEHRVVLAGRATRYFDAGSGRPVVFVHAFPFSAEMWRPQLERVPKGWRFIAPDLRGFGPSDIGGSPALTMDDHAEDIAAFMDALTIERAVVAGLSMGGYAMFALFRHAPERFDRLVLADTRPQPDTPDGLRARRALLEVVRTNGVSAVADDLSPKLLGETSRRERADVVAEVRRLIESNTAAAIEAAIQALMSRPDSTPDLDRIACPTLVIVGEEDTVTPVADARAMHQRIPNSELAVLPRTGHLSNLEAAEAFSETLSRFLDKT
jgi:pimeloyl-ACP methyl ester carboxylesterase